MALVNQRQDLRLVKYLVRLSIIRGLILLLSSVDLQPDALMRAGIKSAFQTFFLFFLGQLLKSHLGFSMG